MPPKRKRTTDDGDATTQAPTRKSARKQPVADVNETAGGSKKATTKGRGKKAAAVAGEEGNEPLKKPTRTTRGEAAVATEPPHEPPATTTQTIQYTPAAALRLFKAYADPEGQDDPAIDPEGLERLCKDADLPMEGSLPVILAWQLEADEMGTITQAQWEKGMATLRCASLPVLSTALHALESVLVLGKTRPKGKKGALPATVDAACDTPDASFAKLYVFAFVLAKQGSSRNIEIETATALWSVLLAPKYPLAAEIIEFVNEKEGTYKAVTKDIWNMVLEFVQATSPNLDNFDADGAWPSLIDDFVEWKKAK